MFTRDELAHLREQAKSVKKINQKRSPKKRIEALAEKVIPEMISKRINKKITTLLKRQQLQKSASISGNNIYFYFINSPAAESILRYLPYDENDQCQKIVNSVIDRYLRETSLLLNSRGISSVLQQEEDHYRHNFPRIKLKITFQTKPIKTTCSGTHLHSKKLTINLEDLLEYMEKVQKWTQGIEQAEKTKLPRLREQYLDIMEEGIKREIKRLFQDAERRKENSLEIHAYNLANNYAMKGKTNKQARQLREEARILGLDGKLKKTSNITGLAQKLLLELSKALQEEGISVKETDSKRNFIIKLS